MAPKSRIIIDTDPGVDDVLALLLALSASSDDIEVLLLSVTFGNVELQNCLRNVVSMFHVIENEMTWRRNHGLSEGFDALKRSKPMVAVGADQPLGDQPVLADYFHGVDGLGGVHTSHPHHSSPEETWKHLFDRPPPETLLSSTAIKTAYIDPNSSTSLFTPSNKESHLEILRILDENPPDTITIIAIGPLTNLAYAASHAPITFMRAKSVLVMGGAIFCPGNITPVGEFNTLADAHAAARVFALTSPDPASTMPPVTSLLNDGSRYPALPPYPSKEELGSRRLNLILFPLDLTTPVTIRRGEFHTKTKPLIARGSPLAEWTSAFLEVTFRNVETLHHGHQGDSTELSLHDPLCVWYALREEREKDLWEIARGEDIRIETAGQWTRGMCIIDRRTRKMYEGGEDAPENEVKNDAGDWLSKSKGNRLSRCIKTPGHRALAPLMLDTIFG